MIEAMLWTMAQPLLAEQLPDEPETPDHGAVHRCNGPDEWISVGSLKQVPSANVSPERAASRLTSAGIPAASLARSADLVASEHLRARGFWDPHGSGVLPGLPWRASFGRATGPTPALGADTDRILREVAGMSVEEIAHLRNIGAVK